MENVKWLTVIEWEKKHNKEYPLWASVWNYDGYGECWETSEWRDVKDYFEEKRKETKESRKYNAAWDFQFEPMVCLPTDTPPRWGDGTSLKYNDSDA